MKIDLDLIMIIVVICSACFATMPLPVAIILSALTIAVIINWE